MIKKILVNSLKLSVSNLTMIQKNRGEIGKLTLECGECSMLQNFNFVFISMNVSALNGLAKFLAT